MEYTDLLNEVASIRYKLQKVRVALPNLGQPLANLALTYLRKAALELYEMEDLLRQQPEIATEPLLPPLSDDDLADAIEVANEGSDVAS